MPSPFADPTKYGTHPRSMRRVVIESPYKGNFIQRWLNRRYARKCLRDALKRGESPLASHLLYTQPGVLDDGDKAERAQGINAGHAWLHHANAVVVYEDRGVSEGMRAAIGTAEFHRIPIEYRRINQSTRR